MGNRGLLFIPDISGFTRFVNETDIDHSRLIIQELLETLISTNRSGLEVSEIEGDAILFYKFGDVPGINELYKQVEAMFCGFHRHLSAYDNTRFCQCKACNSASGLTLKIITHYGEFTGYNVSTFSKLIGKDVIVAHQLLKNDIDQHEYWLVTDPLVMNKPLSGPAPWMEWTSSAKQTESGEIPFQYVQLGELKQSIEPDPFPTSEFARRVKEFSVSREYDAEMIPLLHAAGNLRYRHRWQEGVKKVEELNHWLPRVGMRSRFILEEGETIVRASSYLFRPEHIEFSETDESSQDLLFFTIEKLAPGRCRLTIDYYRMKGLLGGLLFDLTRKKKLEGSFQRGLEKIGDLVKEIPDYVMDMHVQ
ncbi:DUF2652 domain-containing protein [Puia sp.]|jgi:hypothetical protein|uniref:DUF2652 domain-containing protein n=1 Tax=Puia sp. TaxID=2045100 RepID=UPI002F3EF8CA